MNIAHFSDLHLFALEGVGPHRFLNKRLTGWANLRLRRHAVHRPAYVRAIAQAIARAGVDHVVITGDLTNLALEAEFQIARDLIERDLGLDPAQVSVVPGNHDVYTSGAHRSRRFQQYFEAWLRSDLPEVERSARSRHARWVPVVKLRGPAAIIGLSSAVPQPPFVAAGTLGRAQLAALAEALAHPEVKARTPVLALHHPAVTQWTRLKQQIEGLRDSHALLALLAPLRGGLVLHGHLHRRVHATSPASGGIVHHAGATSASLHHDSPDRMAGYNVYAVDGTGVTRLEARVYRPDDGTFASRAIPELGARADA